MPVTLAEANNGAQTDLDVAVIDEFRKNSAILDALVYVDAVNPAGGGAVLTYGYRRLVTQAGAAFRQLNTEYTPGEVTTALYTIVLAPLGGSFQIDRVIAKIGPAAQNETTLQMNQKIKSTSAKFNDAIINGDTAVDANGFDGLDKALSGSSTEVGVGAIIDWSDFDTDTRAPLKALDTIDSFLSYLDGPPTLLISNQWVLARVRAAARRANMYVQSPVGDILDQQGRPVLREQYGNLILVDAGFAAGSNTPVIPLRTRDLDGSKFTVTITGSPTGGTYTLTITPAGFTAVTTAPIAYNATRAATLAAIQAALATLGLAATAATDDGTNYVFAGPLRFNSVTMTSTSTGLTGGSSPAATVAAVGTSSTTGNLSDLYAVRIGEDGFHAVTVTGAQIVQTWLPDFQHAGAVKTGEVELGPIGVALKASKAAAVLRNIKVA